MILFFGLCRSRYTFFLFLLCEAILSETCEELYSRRMSLWLGSECDVVGVKSSGANYLIRRTFSVNSDTIFSRHYLVTSTGTVSTKHIWIVFISRYLIVDMNIICLFETTISSFLNGQTNRSSETSSSDRALRSTICICNTSNLGILSYQS